MYSVGVIAGTAQGVARPVLLRPVSDHAWQDQHFVHTALPSQP